ncbi:unnamed protein product [Linum trigynum]|uniref:Uncharacterized protein n=1 Tax=Linum trigynum TaxID=586398 RepID=A0AAV2GLS3_9ROSI
MSSSQGDCYRKLHEKLIKLRVALKKRKEEWQRRSAEQLWLMERILQILDSPRRTKPPATTVVASQPPPTEASMAPGSTAAVVVPSSPAPPTAGPCVFTSITKHTTINNKDLSSVKMVTPLSSIVVAVPRTESPPQSTIITSHRTKKPFAAAMVEIADVDQEIDLVATATYGSRRGESGLRQRRIFD